MGLDSYLKRSMYTRNEFVIEEIAELLHLPSSINTASGHGTTITLPWLYWRKNWAIHRWFVEHVQDGEDDCNEHEVYLDSLVELRDDIAHALKYPETTSTLFSDWQPQSPPSWQDEEMANTRDWLSAEIAARQSTETEPNPYYNYTYRASW